MTGNREQGSSSYLTQQQVTVRGEKVLPSGSFCCQGSPHGYCVWLSWGRAQLQLKLFSTGPVRGVLCLMLSLLGVPVPLMLPAPPWSPVSCCLAQGLPGRLRVPAPLPWILLEKELCKLLFQLPRGRNDLEWNGVCSPSFLKYYTRIPLNCASHLPNP